MQGVEGASAPSPPPGFVEVGRRPETSLVDSWQSTPPKETQITSVPCVTLKANYPLL